MQTKEGQLIIAALGMWRSLVAHLHGVQGVASSNPAIPTKKDTPDQLVSCSGVFRLGCVLTKVLEDHLILSRTQGRFALAASS